MTTLKEVSGNLQSVDQKLVSVREGQEDQNKVQTDNSEMLKLVMEDVAMRVGRSGNILSQMFGHVGYIRRNLKKSGGTTGDDLERERETKEWQSSLLEAIQNISSASDDKDNKSKKEESKSLLGLMRLGGLASLSAVALGGLLGSISGLMKPLTSIVGWFRKKLTPKILTSYMGMIGNVIKSGFAEGITKVKNGFSQAGKFISSMGNKFKSIFTEGKLGKVLTGISTRFKSLKDSLSVLGKTLSFAGGGKSTGVFEKVGGTLKKIFEKFGSFGKALGSVFKLVSRVFAPLSAIFITGKTIIEDLMSGEFGFGTLGRVVDDLLKFFFVDLADMVKDAISWVSEKLGFGKFSKFLDSFKFSDFYEDVKAFMMRLRDVFTFKNLALLATGDSKAKGIGYIFGGETGISSATVTNRPTGSQQLTEAVKENETTKTASNIVMMDNSTNTTSAPSAPSQPIPLPGPSSSFDHFDPGTRMA